MRHLFAILLSMAPWLCVSQTNLPPLHGGVVSSLPAAPAPLQIQTRIAVVIPMADTNALYTLWRCDNMVSNIWSQTSHRRVRVQRPCTNIWFESIDAPRTRFYKLIKTTDETVAVTQYAINTNRIPGVTLSAPPMPPAYPSK